MQNTPIVSNETLVKCSSFQSGSQAELHVKPQSAKIVQKVVVQSVEKLYVVHVHKEYVNTATLLSYPDSEI